MICWDTPSENTLSLTILPNVSSVFKLVLHFQHQVKITPRWSLINIFRSRSLMISNRETKSDQRSLRSTTSLSRNAWRGVCRSTDSSVDQLLSTHSSTAVSWIRSTSSTGIQFRFGIEIYTSGKTQVSLDGNARWQQTVLFLNMHAFLRTLSLPGKFAATLAYQQLFNSCVVTFIIEWTLIYLKLLVIN